MVVMYNSLIIYKGPTLPDPYRAPTTRSNNLLKVWSQLIVDGFVFITEGFVRAVWTDHNDTGLLQPRKHDSLMPAHFHRPIHKCPQHKMSPVVEYLFRLAPDLSLEMTHFWLPHHSLLTNHVKSYTSDQCCGKQRDRLFTYYEATPSITY